MADSSSEESTSSGGETSGSDSNSDNEFDRNKNKELAEHKIKRFRRRQRSETSSPESSDPKHKEKKVKKKKHQKEKEESSDNTSSISSSSDEEIKKKKESTVTAVRKRSYNNEEDRHTKSTHKRQADRHEKSSHRMEEDRYGKSFYRMENESRSQIKERHIKREHEDRGAYYDRKQHDDEHYGKIQRKDDDNRCDYNDNEKYIKNEDGSKYKYKEENRYIKNEEYDNYNNSKDHRKRKNEHRMDSPEDKYHRHIKNEDDDYKRDGDRDKQHGVKREENTNQRKHHDNRRHQRKSKQKTERDWDKGKNEHLYDDPIVDENNRGSIINRRSKEVKKKFGRDNQSDSTNNKPVKEEANYGLSGKLTEFTNTYNGVVIMYNEPPEARKPKTKWRFYPFKGEKALTMLQLHRQSAFLLGRDRKIADIPVDHPSCSKQHAVLQFRLVDYERTDGITGKRVKPYIIDLDSRNGTHVNNNRIDGRKYVELMEKDVVKFGFSSRDYVLLHEKSEDVQSSQDEGDEDDNEAKNK